eukprot:GHVU01032763.1.p1 GENE.GHVU01032763.1~~GHVU01032763.1.p1  ORF type:complete len:274 (-),score=59.50 GHVU01032763.1:2004-2783(-)
MRSENEEGEKDEQRDARTMGVLGQPASAGRVPSFTRERTAAREFLQSMDMGPVRTRTEKTGGVVTYAWRETTLTVDVIVPVGGPGVTRSDVEVISSSDKLFVGRRNDEVPRRVLPLLQGTLCGKVRADETHWAFDDDHFPGQRSAVVQLQKRKSAQKLWQRLFEVNSDPFDEADGRHYEHSGGITDHLLDRASDAVNERRRRLSDQQQLPDGGTDEADTNHSGGIDIGGGDGDPEAPPRASSSTAERELQRQFQFGPLD